MVQIANIKSYRAAHAAHYSSPVGHCMEARLRQGNDKNAPAQHPVRGGAGALVAAQGQAGPMSRHTVGAAGPGAHVPWRSGPWATRHSQMCPSLVQRSPTM